MKNIHAWLLSINMILTSFIGVTPVFAEPSDRVETPLISTHQKVGNSTESTETTEIGSNSAGIVYTVGTLGYIQTDDMTNEPGNTGPKLRRVSLRLTENNSTQNQTFHAFYYKNPGSTSYGIVYWQYDSEYEEDAYLQAQTSNDTVIWNNLYGTVYRLRSSFTYSDNGITGTTLHYWNFSPGYGDTITYLGDWVEKYTPGTIPRIDLKSGQDYQTILAVISGDLKIQPWNYSDSSGGRHFEDGTSLTPEQNRQYENVYVVMDSNNDNSISEEEVNNYNTTYNTNYNYQSINNGNDFDEMQFLNYIAILFANGQDVPGSGGSGEGGEGGSGSGGYGTIQQQQKIENGAVQVNVTTGDMVNENSAEFINTIINGSPSGQNAFEGAITNMRGFINVATEFTALAAAVLGFLPGWVVGLFELLFTVTIVMAIFRIIHLFI